MHGQRRSWIDLERDRRNQRPTRLFRRVREREFKVNPLLLKLCTVQLEGSVQMSRFIQWGAIDNKAFSANDDGRRVAFGYRRVIGEQIHLDVVEPGP